MTFSEKIRKRLEELKWSQADLAKAIGTNQPQVSAWLGSESMPSTPYAVKIGAALGLSLDYLLNDAIETPEPETTETERLLLAVARDVGVGAILRELATGRLVRSARPLREEIQGELDRELARERERAARYDELRRESEMLYKEFEYTSVRLKECLGQVVQLDAERSHLMAQVKEQSGQKIEIARRARAWLDRAGGMASGPEMEAMRRRAMAIIENIDAEATTNAPIRPKRQKAE